MENALRSAEDQLDAALVLHAGIQLAVGRHDVGGSLPAVGHAHIVGHVHIHLEVGIAHVDGGFHPGEEVVLAVRPAHDHLGAGHGLASLIDHIHLQDLREFHIANVIRPVFQYIRLAGCGRWQRGGWQGWIGRPGHRDIQRGSLIRWKGSMAVR